MLEHTTAASERKKGLPLFIVFHSIRRIGKVATVRRSGVVLRAACVREKLK